MHEDSKIEIMNIQYSSLTQCTVEFLHWDIQVILKLFCLKLGLITHSLIFFIITKTISDSPFLQVKFLKSILQMVVSVGTMQLTLSIAIMQVPASVAIMQVLRFYCNYVGGISFKTYVSESFCCSYEGDCFCYNYAVRIFCNIYAGESFCSKYVGDNFYWNYAGGSICCNHAGGIFYSVLCTWLFLL